MKKILLLAAVCCMALACEKKEQPLESLAGTHWVHNIAPWNGDDFLDDMYRKKVEYWFDYDRQVFDIYYLGKDDKVLSGGESDLKYEYSYPTLKCYDKEGKLIDGGYTFTERNIFVDAKGREFYKLQSAVDF